MGAWLWGAGQARGGRSIRLSSQVIPPPWGAGRPGLGAAPAPAGRPAAVGCRWRGRLPPGRGPTRI